MKKKKQGIIAGVVLVGIIIAAVLIGTNRDEPAENKEGDATREANEETVVWSSELSAPHFDEVSVHDPSIIKTDDQFYVFGTHIEAAKSDDLISWERFTNGYQTPDNVLYDDLSNNLAESFLWAGEDDADSSGGFSVWAPDIFWNPDYQHEDGTTGAYMMHYSVSSTYIRSAIGFAVAKDIEGPYQYVDTLVYSGFTEDEQYDEASDVNKQWRQTHIDELIEEGTLTAVNDDWFNGDGSYNNRDYPNAIDANLFFSADGRLYMSYGSWSGGIFLLELDETTGAVIYPSSDGETEDGRMIDSYFGTKLSGGYYESGEGPYIEYNAETAFYYLYVTYGWLEADGAYHMRQFRSASPEGPYVDAAGKPAVLPANTSNSQFGNKLMGNFMFKRTLGEPGLGPGQGYMSPGHNSVYTDPDTGAQFLAFHSRFPNQGEGHQLRIHQMFMNQDGWPVVAPKRYAGEALVDDFTVEEIAGSYKYINHGKDNATAIKESKPLTLHSDGTLSGAVEGTWKHEGADATLTINDIDYQGVFVEVWDEQSKRGVMSFTALSDQGVSIWGVQSLSSDLASHEIVEEVVKGLSIGNPNHVTRDLDLVTEAFDGATIDWVTSDETIIDQTGKVDRPNGKDGVVTLTATITHDQETMTKQFEVTVRGQESAQLVSYLPFDGDLIDQEDDSHTVTTTGDKIDHTGGEITFDQGLKNQAAYFDGTSGLRLKDGIIDQAAYTVSMFIKPEQFTQHTSAFFAATTPEQWISVVPYGHTEQTMVWSGSETWFDASAMRRIKENEWHHLGVVVEGEGLTFYINGEEVFQGDGLAVDLSSGASYFGLGVNHWDPPFNGWIDEVRLYQGALSEEEIAQLAE